MSKKLDEINLELDYQILMAKNSAITEKVLPTFPSSLETQEHGFGAMVDLRWTRTTKSKIFVKHGNTAPK